MQVAVPAIVQSKKFVAAALASTLTFLGLQQGLTLEQVGIITAPLYMFIGAQGIADHGKERAKIETSDRPKLQQAKQ